AAAAAPGKAARPCPCPCPLPRADTSLSRLVRRLLSARRSLDLCMFSFSCPQLARAVSLLHRRGVRVRIVTDAQFMGLHGSQIGRLRHAGIQVRHDQHSGYMHHKFAIVDRRMLITGSLNWTSQAIQTNRENVLVVDDAECVKPFLDEFERIWEEYNPTNYSF
ncbi:PLD6 hydrolase, partial [Neodrepanis coruscans]|nr:PLD6 hydrolase [Neodrepanis coruscans]